MGRSSAEDGGEDPAGRVPRMEQSVSLSSHPWPNPLTAGSPPASRRAAAIQSDFMNQNHLLLHEAQVRHLASLSRRDSR